MKRLVFALIVLCCSATGARAASLTLTINNGLVSLDAQDVTVRQILTEWERVGKTRIINGERIAGAPITLKLEQVPEKQALDIVLRSIPGYMALPRATTIADGSLYERVLIMATTAQVAPLRPQQQPPAFGLQGAQGGPPATQLRPNVPPLFPGMLTDPQDQADQLDDPAIAAAAAAGLVPIPGFVPGQAPISAPLLPPGIPMPPTQPAQGAPGATGTGAPTNPWNAPVGTAQPSLAPPPPVMQPPPPARGRPQQADR